MINCKYDVFIAYHGTYETGGTQIYAHNLCDYLKSKGLKVFFFPESGKDAYKTNILEAINSRTFILVVNENIHRDKSKKIDFRYHYELMSEIDAFYSLLFVEENKRTALDAKVIFCGEYNSDFIQGDESLLHNLFSNRVHMSNKGIDEEVVFESVYSWISPKKDSLLENTYSNSKVSNEIQKLYSRRNTLISGEQLDDLVAQAKKIVCIGISNSDLTKRVDQYALRSALEGGAIIEMYFLDPNSQNTVLRQNEEGFTDDIIKLETTNNLITARSFKNNLPDYLKDNYRIYLYDKIPRLNIIFVDDNLFLQFYGFISRGMDTPSMVIKKQKNISPMYDYCTKSYEYIKKDAIEVLK